jgi:hypothetical protein
MKQLSIRRTLAACAAMVLATAGASLYAADAPPAHPAEALPKADTILDKYFEVMGGKAVLAKVHNQVIAGAFEMPAMGIKGTMTITKTEPDKSMAEIEIPGIGTVREGYDGSVAWEINPMQGARIKDGAELAASKREAHFHSENWREEYKKVETVGSEAVDGKDCYKLVKTPSEGSPVTEYYDKKTGLLAKVTMTVTSPMGEMEATTIPSDYRKEGDVLVPHKILQSAGPQEFSLTFDSYKFNVEIPKGKFDLPEEIKALVKK